MTQSAALITSRLCSIRTNRVARVHERVEGVEERLDVVEVEARRRLVEQVERVAGVLLREVRGQLHALRLPARERVRRLPQREVAQTDVLERPGSLFRDAPLTLEEGDSLVDREVEHLGHVLPLVPNLEDVLLEPTSVARLAFEVEVGEELHLDLDDALALARLAPAAGHVERERPRPVPTDLRLVRRGE